MSSSRFAGTIELAPKPSARAVIVLFWVHALPLALLMASPLERWVMAGLALAIGLSWWWLRRHAVFGYGARAVQKLIGDADGGWQLETGSSARHAAQLLGSSVVLGRVMVLNFQAPGGRLTRILMGDELPADQLQALQARLSAGVASAQP